jgi:hypothetical protein
MSKVPADNKSFDLTLSVGSLVYFYAFAHLEFIHSVFVCLNLERDFVRYRDRWVISIRDVGGSRR